MKKYSQQQIITQYFADLDYEDCDVLEIQQVKEDKKIAEKMKIDQTKRNDRWRQYFYDGYCIEHDLNGCTQCRWLAEVGCMSSRYELPHDF
jgi:hypothetical protein